jgi:lysophospholipase L1-like esterase
MIDQDRQPGRATATGVRFRAAIAVALPIILLLMTRLVDLDPIFLLIVGSTTALVLTIALTWALVLIELRCAATLARLIRARGDLQETIAMERDPRLAIRRRLRRFRIAVVALSFALAFGFCELIFRIWNIQPAEPLPPAAHPVAQSYADGQTNALGLREPWHTLPDDNRLRILFLGDSIVYGHAVEREEAFCALTEPMLAPSIPRGVRTINGGVSGFGPHQEHQFYIDLREAVQPDLVVQVVYLNDFGVDLTHMLDMIYRLRDYQYRISDYSYVFRFAERQVRYWLAWKYTRDYFRGGGTPTERNRAWDRFAEDVTRCAQTIRQDGVAYALVLFPVLVELDRYPFGDMHDMVASLADRLDVPYLDLLPVFQGRNALSLRIAPSDEHPNAEGHRLAAERIVEFLIHAVLPRLDLDSASDKQVTDDINPAEGV